MADVLVMSSNLILVSECTISRNHLKLNRSIFNRIITSEGTETLVLAFTSKTGQSVAHNRHRISNSDFSVRERLYLGIL